MPSSHYANSFFICEKVIFGDKVLPAKAAAERQEMGPGQEKSREATIAGKLD